MLKGTWFGRTPSQYDDGSSPFSSALAIVLGGAFPITAGFVFGLNVSPAAHPFWLPLWIIVFVGMVRLMNFFMAGYHDHSFAIAVRCFVYSMVIVAGCFGLCWCAVHLFVIWGSFKIRSEK